MSADISVLIPVYNGEKYIGEAIESVLKQTLRPLEIVVVDDGSADESCAVAASFPGVRCVSIPHQGIAAARNRAVKEAIGEWIAFLDSDDLWMPDKLEKQMAYLSSHPGCEIVFCRYRNFSELLPETMTERQKTVLAGYVDQYLASACIRKSLFERCGLFDIRYGYGEDTEWTARAGFAGVDTRHCIEECLYLRRIHESNITLTHNQIRKEEYLSLMADAIRNARKKGE